MSFESTSRLELVLYPLVMLIMLLLSVTWFVPLSQGTAKVWRERSWAARAELLRLQACNHALEIMGPPALRRFRMDAMKDWFARHIK